ncbi:MAG TPA: sulfatase-like hydrolase/transferase [Casimicrobiaceae bacterium]|nr:sulfatase-like hydrolase/transferase [Casimicrobiaceae bacterium]
MSNHPNIILFITDQQRSDTISALGAPWMRTPTLDRLVAEGAAFTHCFTTSPICVGARASLFSGCFPHMLNVYRNFDQWEPSWVRWLTEAGYHCASIGKMHINPYDAKGGFHQRFPVENKDRALFLEEPERAIYDEWDKALNAHGVIKPSRYTRFANNPEGFRHALGAFVWDLPEALHSDNFIGDTALWWLEQRRAVHPLFLHIGFCGPHPPYDPVQRYLDLYDNIAIPVPEVADHDLRGQTPALHALRETMEIGNFDSVAWRSGASKKDLLRLRRHYAANITMIDEKIGEILEVLDRRGYLRDAVVIFTSDHGDNLGEHRHIQKHNMYEGAVRVPLIITSPGRIAEGRTIDQFVQWIDIAPTILDCAGVTVPENWESRSLWPLIEDNGNSLVERDAVYAELARDHIQRDAELMVMRRDRKWKVVFYLGQSCGELYDLESDSGEANNLWESPQHREVRDELVGKVLRWQIQGTLRSRSQARASPQQPMIIP